MKYSVKNLCKINSYQKVSLKGRNYIVPTDLSADEITSVFATAIELKTAKPNYLELLAGKNMTYLVHEPCLKLQTALHDTATLLKMPLNNLKNANWEIIQNSQDFGKLLSSTADIIFCRAQRQSKIGNFAKGSTVPVINICSCSILSELLTIQEHFGTLQDIVFAWVGTSCPHLNRYLAIGPSLGMKVKFLCRCGGAISPSNLDSVKSTQGEEFAKKIKECKKVPEVIEGANVVATTKHEENNLTLKLADLEKYAAKDWVFLHTLPRSVMEVEDKVFDSERNLLWQSFLNSKWIYAAIIAMVLGKEKKFNSDNHTSNCCG